VGLLDGETIPYQKLHPLGWSSSLVSLLPLNFLILCVRKPFARCPNMKKGYDVTQECGDGQEMCDLWKGTGYGS